VLAIVTFDLRGANSGHYNALKKKLSAIGLEPHIDKATGSALFQLPNNTAQTQHSCHQMQSSGQAI
jgi:hypothetical protein